MAQKDVKNVTDRLLLTDGGLVDEITQDDIDYDELKNVCKRRLDWFFRKAAKHTITGKNGRHIYIQHENAKVLAVAHADTVVDPGKHFNFNILHRKIENGNNVRIVKTPTLDDRLGMYTIMNLLPSILGNEWADILITEGEESGNSTAVDFETDKEYNWIVEFDRAGSFLTDKKVWGNNDAVLYEFKGKEFEDALTECGFKNLGTGSFTDISHLQRLKVKGFNMAVGYHDNHSTKAYFFPEEYARTINLFLEFYNKHSGHKFEHVPVVKKVYKYTGNLFPGGSAKGTRAYPRTYIKSGWIPGARFKMGDFVEYTILRNKRTFIVDGAHITDGGTMEYDISHITGSTYMYGVEEHQLILSHDTCYNCVTKTDFPLHVFDTDITSFTLCPDCHAYLIGDFSECDFCHDHILTDELLQIGMGYVACINCADKPSGGNYESDMTFLPGDVVKAKAGGEIEYEVTGIDGGGQLFMSYVDRTNDVRTANNGGYGFDPELFYLVRVARRLL